MLTQFEFLHSGTDKLRLSVPPLWNDGVVALYKFDKSQPAILLKIVRHPPLCPASEVRTTKTVIPDLDIGVNQ